MSRRGGRDDLLQPRFRDCPRDFSEISTPRFPTAMTSGRRLRTSETWRREV